MEEKALEQKEREKTLVIRINLTRGLVAVLIAALLVVAGVGYLAWGQQGAEASSLQVFRSSVASSTGMRKFYMSYYGHQGNLDVDNVCATGYHMASLWEIVDLSNLEYATDLVASGVAESRDDAGHGPPTFLIGWVHTGYDNSHTGSAGQANCDGWSSSDENHDGTAAALPRAWAPGADIGAWEFAVTACDVYAKVWCIED
jgi:hypothetical protein